VREPEEVLRGAETIVLVDWPSSDVPDTLARAGYRVFVKGGPGPDDYNVREVRDGEVISTPAGHAPAHADLVYAFRPLGELPGIVDLARRAGAPVVWYQSGMTSAGARDPRACWMDEADSRTARGLVEGSGLTYVDSAYIADVARRIGTRA